MGKFSQVDHGQCSFGAALSTPAWSACRVGPKYAPAAEMAIVPHSLNLPGMRRFVVRPVCGERFAGFDGSVVDESVALALGHTVLSGAAGPLSELLSILYGSFNVLGSILCRNNLFP
jgi:hypothetical protein